MKLKLNYECFDKGLEKLSQEYKIFAPVVLEYKGTYSDTPSIRYKEVKKFEYQNCDIHVKEYNLKLKHKKEENNDK